MKYSAGQDHPVFGFVAVGGGERLRFGEPTDFFYGGPVACDCEAGRPVLVAGVHDGTDEARVSIEVGGKVSGLVVGDRDGDSHLIVASHLGHWPSYALRILLPMYHSHLGHRVTLPQSVLVVVIFVSPCCWFCFSCLPVS